ncbi:MAG: transglycosylase SLT domain-containing protein [Nitrosomonas sp.]|nr:transglycosylase SLT domain-containing protein [Nitrosomonas sp.]
MSNIKSDNQGFLIGEPLDINGTFALWTEIRDDMKAIRKALAGGERVSSVRNLSPNNDVREKQPSQPHIATPRRSEGSRDARVSSSTPLISSALNKAIERTAAKTIATPSITSAAAKAAQKAIRDTQTGRFTKKGGGSPLLGDDSSNDRYVDSSPSSDDSAVRAAAGKIADAVTSAGSGMEETDPAIKAFSEVAQPMARGYEILTAGTGREQKDTFRWFRKIFGEIKLFRKDETAFNKAANKSLKNIEETTPAADASGGDSSWLRRYILPMLAVALPFLMSGTSGVGGTISKAWDETIADFKSVAVKIINSWDSTTDKFNNVLSSIGSKIESFWNTFTGFAKDKFGVDIPKAIKPITSKVSNVFSKVKHQYDIAKSEAGSVLEKTVMPKGYRHKELFDGIKGGDDLSKYGTYTDAEAQRIRALKTSAANTSANIPGGMPQEIRDKISTQAEKHGLDPVMMQKIAAMESGGNPNAISKTGALGLYQFTGQTASGVGIKNRFDVDQNIEGGMKLTVQNMAMLKKSGLPVTAENIYMMHQLGPSAAQEIIRGSEGGKSKADLSSNTQRSMNHNYGANSRTASEYIDIK